MFLSTVTYIKFLDLSAPICIFAWTCFVHVGEISSPLGGVSHIWMVFFYPVGDIFSLMGDISLICVIFLYSG